MIISITLISTGSYLLISKNTIKMKESKEEDKNVDLKEDKKTEETMFKTAPEDDTYFNIDIKIDDIPIYVDRDKVQDILDKTGYKLIKCKFGRYLDDIQFYDSDSNTMDVESFAYGLIKKDNQEIRILVRNNSNKDKIPFEQCVVVEVYQGYSSVQDIKGSLSINGISVGNNTTSTEIINKIGLEVKDLQNNNIGDNYDWLDFSFTNHNKLDAALSISVDNQKAIEKIRAAHLCD